MTKYPLVQMLKWESPTGLQQLERSYRGQLSSLMGGLLKRATGSDRVRANRIRERLAGQSRTSRMQLLSAPVMVHRLTCSRSTASALAFIEAALDAEAIRADAPAVCGIPIDHSSPHARARFNRHLPPYSPFRDSEIRSFTRKICRAIQAVRTISPTAAEATDLYIKEIVVRRNPRSPSKHTSFSWYRYIGRIGIVNPHWRGFSTMQMTDSLVHETIHAFEYVHELQAPMVTRRSLAERTWVTSPWTGNNLSVHSFAGACLVWFGLWNFWRLASARAVFPESLVQRRVECCAAGFRSAGLDEALETPIILPDFKQCVHQMRRIVHRQ